MILLNLFNIPMKTLQNRHFIKFIDKEIRIQKGNLISVTHIVKCRIMVGIMTLIKVAASP